MTPDGRLLSANRRLRIKGFSSPAKIIPERTDVANQAYAQPVPTKRVQAIIAEKGFINGMKLKCAAKTGTTILDLRKYTHCARRSGS